METVNKTRITIEATVNAPVATVWKKWNNPADVRQWNSPSEDWHTTAAANDLSVGGKFSYTMAAKDGSFQFDFAGVYDTVEAHKQINYTLGDGRKVEITFTAQDEKTHISTTFDTEEINPVEMQRGGWQAILDNFKKFVEAGN